MTTQQEIIQLLKAELVSSQFKNSAYSMRALAKKLKTSPSAVSEILNGRRPITKQTGARILSALSLPTEKVNQLLEKLPTRYTKKIKSNLAGQHTTFSEVDSAQFDLISNWYYFGILSLAETKTFKDDPAWIARRLNIKVSEAKKALQTLLSFELLKKTNLGVRPTGKQFKTTTDISDASIRKHHLQNLDILRGSLESDPVDSRDFSTMTVTFDPAQMQKAKELIKDFRRNFSKEVEKTKKKEVYRLSVQFIPLSQEVLRD